MDKMESLNTGFPVEAKAFEIKEALRASRQDNKTGKVIDHKKVMAAARKKLRSRK